MPKDLKAFFKVNILFRFVCKFDIKCLFDDLQDSF